MREEERYIEHRQICSRVQGEYAKRRIILLMKDVIKAEEKGVNEEW